MAHQNSHLLLQFLAAQKRVLQSLQAARFSARQHIWILGINRRKMPIAERIRLAVDLDSAVKIVDAVQQSSMIQAPLRIALDDLPLKLKLHDGGGFCIRATSTLGRNPSSLGMKYSAGSFA